MPIYDCTSGQSSGPRYVAGDGIVIQGEQIEVGISSTSENTTKIRDGAIYTYIQYPNATYPLIEVHTAPVQVGLTVSAVNGDSTITGTTNADGIAALSVTAWGNWSISATVGDISSERTINITGDELYAVSLSFYERSVFGVAWDKTNPSTQLTRLTPGTDPNGLVTVAVTEEPQPAIGAAAGSSPFDNFMPWLGMTEYNIIDGVVSYQKSDPGFSRTAYDTMVYIPPFYCAVREAGDMQYFYVSNEETEGLVLHPGSGRYVSRYNLGSGYQSVSGVLPLGSVTRAGFRAGISSKGANWFQYDFATYCAILWLYIIEFADWNSQGTIGAGITEATALQPNGGTDPMVYHTGRADGVDSQSAVQYRGIENLWGNVWEFVDGLISNSSTAYICTDPSAFSDTVTGAYTDAGVTLPVVYAYLRSLTTSNTFPWVLLPAATGGSATTYIPDYSYISSGSHPLFVSGVLSEGQLAGLFYFNANNAIGISHPQLGGRSAYVEQP